MSGGIGTAHSQWGLTIDEGCRAFGVLELPTEVELVVVEERSLQLGSIEFLDFASGSGVCAPVLEAIAAPAKPKSPPAKLESPPQPSFLRSAGRGAKPSRPRGSVAAGTSRRRRSSVDRERAHRVVRRGALALEPTVDVRTPVIVFVFGMLAAGLIVSMFG